MPAQRHAVIVAAALGACFLLYAGFGVAKEVAEWRIMDIVGEGGTALVALAWTLIVLTSRPGGRVTRLLALGLGAIMLGSWADCLDEFYRVDKAALWDNALEALVPGGMAVLTAGLFSWRQEQVRLTEHLQKRERLFRQHRGFDKVTQLAGASYLREQLRREQAAHPQGQCALVLLDIDRFHAINREHGRAEGDRVLQAVSHMLLLNLRNDDLLCRYAGDRFAVLMPGLDEQAARRVASHLCAMVEAMHHHAGTVRLPLTLRHGCAGTSAVETDGAGGVDAVLAELARRIDTATA